MKSNLFLVSHCLGSSQDRVIYVAGRRDMAGTQRLSYTTSCNCREQGKGIFSGKKGFLLVE